MKALNPFKYVTPFRDRWKAQVKSEHVGVYITAQDAAVAADRYIVEQIEPRDIRYVGQWELNFPDKWLPPTGRMIATARKRGEVYSLFGQYLTPNDLVPDSGVAHTTQTTPPLTGNKWLDIYNQLVAYDPKILEWYPTYEPFSEYCEKSAYEPLIIRNHLRGNYKSAGLQPPELNF